MAYHLLARLSTEHLGPELTAQLQATLFDILDGIANDYDAPADRNQRTVLHGLSHRLQADPRLDVPEDWLAEACRLTRATPWWVAHAACECLSAWARAGRLADSSENLRQRWRRALLAATQDGRALIAGMAGHALRLGQRVEPQHFENDEGVRTVLAQLRGDPRVGIRRQLEWADQMSMVSVSP